MATILDQEDKDKENQGEQVLSNGSGTIESQGSAGAGASGSQSQPGGGGFTNLQQYVTANQGNDAAMGQKVEQNVGQNAQAADQAIGQYQSGAQNKIKQGTVTQDKSVSDALKTSPEKIVQDQGLKSQFDKQYNAKFGGETQASAYDGYSQAAGQAQKVQQQGQNAAGDNTARRSLLNDVYARPDYGTGQQNLDSFIIGAGQGGQQSLQNINQQYSQYGQKAQQATDDVQNQITQAQKTTQDTKDATRGLLNAQSGKYDSQFKGLRDYAGQQAAAQQAEYQTTTSGLSSQDPGVRSQAFQKIGLDPKTGEFLVSEGYSPAQLIQAGQSKSMGDYANSDDVTHYQALRSLGGEGGDYDFNKSNSDGLAFHADQGKLGAAQQAYGLTSSLQQKLQQAQADRENQYQSLMGGLTSFRPDDNAQALSKLGISQADYQYARAHNIDPSQFIGAGRKLDLGDVTDDGQRNQFSNLMGMLGLKGKEDLGYHGSAGNAFNFDNNSFTSQLSGLRAKEAADAAAKAAANAPKPAPAPSPGQQVAAAAKPGTPINTGGPANIVKQADKDGSDLDKATGGNVSKAKKKLHL